MAIITPGQAVFIDSLRVARLGTVGPGAEPHVVPVCFARLGDAIYSAVDRKPKRSNRLQRLRNIDATGRAAVLFDRYSDDWSELGWIMVRGPASIVLEDEEREKALASLRERYEQYVAMDLSRGPVIRITARHVVTWGNLGAT